MSYQITEGSTHNLPDVETVITRLNRLAQEPAAAVRTLFQPNDPLVVARAPGRLDLMGGIADYSGSLVLQLPLAEATLVALQRDAAPALQLVSLRGANHSQVSTFDMPLADFEQNGRVIDYPSAQAYFWRQPDSRWAAYVAGAFLVLQKERDVTFSGGARLLITSTVPEGKGVSSSAALEVATIQAIAAAFEIELTPGEVARLGQQVENLVVGAPCGIMDQMTASCGRTNRLLALLCQPADLQEFITLPDHLAVWGLDSGVSHSVAGADYSSVRVGAFMGYRTIAELAGHSVDLDRPGQQVQIDDPRWSGYLANVTPSEFEQHFATALPKKISGAAFLARYGGFTDAVTQIDPDQTYAVRVPTAHPIYEHFRVQCFAQLLAQPSSLHLLGELMYQSHASYSACGLGSPQTDRLVALVRAAGPRQGLYGAKITGGGSGGTVAILGHPTAGPAVQAVANRYAQETGHRPHIFAGSSPGAAAFGVIKLERGPNPT